MRALPFALLTMLLSGCSPLCSNRTVASLMSPNGEHKAVLFMGESGATTDFTTQVSVDPWFFQFIGNAFVADAYNGGTRGEWGGPWADIKWVGNDMLSITYDQRARLFDQKATAHGVRIEYHPVIR